MLHFANWITWKWKKYSGKKIAQELGYKYLDKDYFLEKLFEIKGALNPEQRAKLSSEASDSFLVEAEKHKNVVLVSHWKTRFSNSGTEVVSILNKFNQFQEIYCHCSTREAANRFLARKRHKMHFDERWSEKELLHWMADYSRGLPLISNGISVSTQENVDVDMVMKTIHNKGMQLKITRRAPYFN